MAMPDICIGGIAIGGIAIGGIAIGGIAIGGIAPGGIAIWGGGGGIDICILARVSLRVIRDGCAAGLPAKVI